MRFMGLGVLLCLMLAGVNIACYVQGSHAWFNMFAAGWCAGIACALFVLYLVS